MAEIKVIMLGGKRVGKSTILAGIMETLGLQGDLSSHFICEDNTDYAAYSNFSIKAKYKNLVRLIDAKRPGSIFMTRGLGDSKIQKYNISLRLSNKPGKLMVDFYDVPGEFTNPKNIEFKSEMLPLIEDSDVFIIGIDTPYLMECSESVNNAHNRITDLEVALQNIMVKDKTDLKMVMFVPLKCEKWIQEGKINDVVGKVKLAYSTLLKTLSAYPLMVVSILPIATVGGIQFSRMAPAQVIKREGVLTGYSCITRQGNEVILSDGNHYKVESPYSIDNDPEAVIDGLKIPNAWFELSPNATYSPMNCEQTALHILRFLIVKTVYKQLISEKENSGFFGYIRNALNSLTNWWNVIDYDAFKSLISDLQKEGKIKDSVEGIEMQHVCEEWKEVELC